MTKLYDEELNARITALSYAIAEKEILLGVIACAEQAVNECGVVTDSDIDLTKADIFKNLQLKELLEVCFEKALKSIRN